MNSRKEKAQTEIKALPFAKNLFFGLTAVAKLLEHSTFFVAILLQTNCNDYSCFEGVWLF
jgi:hypothetical protein